VLRSPRETTQPNRTDTEYWSTGLSLVYLEGALSRALATPAPVATLPAQPSLLPGPAARSVPEAATVSVLDPFSVYDKGAGLLRARLGALSAWHLVNIISAYELSGEDANALNRRPAAELIETIVAGVRAERRSDSPRR